MYVSEYSDQPKAVGFERESHARASFFVTLFHRRIPWMLSQLPGTSVSRTPNLTDQEFFKVTPHGLRVWPVFCPLIRTVYIRVSNREREDKGWTYRYNPRVQLVWTEMGNVTGTDGFWLPFVPIFPNDRRPFIKREEHKKALLLYCQFHVVLVNLYCPCSSLTLEDKSHKSYRCDIFQCSSEYSSVLPNSF